MAHLASKLFVDTSTIYQALNHRYNRRINFSKLKEMADEVICYVVSVKKNNKSNGTHKNTGGLVKFLTTNGFKVVEFKQREFHYLNPAVDVKMAVDIINEAANTSEIAVCTCSTNLVPALEYLKENGIKVKLLSVAPKHNLAASVTEVIEITEDLLYVADKAEGT